MADSEIAIWNRAIRNSGDTKNLVAISTDDSEPATVCREEYPGVRDVALAEHKWPFAKRRAYPAQLGGATWSSTTTYAIGQYVSFAPDQTLIAAPPERLSTFVYVSTGPQSGVNNLNKRPDSSPTFWQQISRAEWAYAYQLPTDIIEIRGLYHAGLRNPREDQKIPHDIGYEPSPGPGQVLFTDGCLQGESLSIPALPIALDYTARVSDVAQFPETFVSALAWGLAAKLLLSVRKDPGAAEKAMVAYEFWIGKAKLAALKQVQRDQAPIPSHIAARWR